MLLYFYADIGFHDVLWSWSFANNISAAACSQEERYGAAAEPRRQRSGIVKCEISV